MKAVFYRPLFIKKYIAVFLFGVFTLGITPKKTLHTLLAKHTDSAAKSNDEKADHLNKAGYNCKCDNLVAESYFIESVLAEISLSAYFSSVIYKKSSFCSVPCFFFDLRGLPTIFQW